MQQSTTTTTTPPLGMNIKSAMAANLGSSLFLFQGLHTISPYVLNTAASPSPSPSKRESTVSFCLVFTPIISKPILTSPPPPPKQPHYFRFELSCTSCAPSSCPISSDYNSKVRLGFSSSSSIMATPSPLRRAGTWQTRMTKKQARDSSDCVQVLRLDLCSYSRKVTLTRDLVSKWVGNSYTEGDDYGKKGSRPKEVDFDGLIAELELQGVEWGMVDKADLEDGGLQQLGGQGLDRDEFSGSWSRSSSRGQSHTTHARHGSSRSGSSSGSYCYGRI